MFRKKLFSIALCIMMCVAYMPASVFAADVHEHTEECYDSSGELVCGMEESQNSEENQDTGTPEASEPVSYVYYTADGEKAIKHTDESCTEYVTVNSETTAFEDGKWYVVAENVTVSGRISVNGTANLILCDGARLEALNGIYVAKGNTLNIYGQGQGTGALTASITDGDERNANSALGSGYRVDCGSINIHGGVITARSKWYAAGIGGGQEGSAGNITIYAGKIDASSLSDGSGIGGGRIGTFDNITIYGGDITADGAANGAGIGGGRFQGSDSGTIQIYGGKVKAKGYHGIGKGDSDFVKEGTLILGDGILFGAGADENNVTVSGDKNNASDAFGNRYFVTPFAADFEYTETEDSITITKYKGSDAEVKIPAQIKNKPVKAIGNNAFYRCYSLTHLELPASIESIGNDAFNNCNDLKTLALPKGLKSIGSNAFFSSGLTSIELPESLESIGNGAFNECYYLTTVQLSEGLESIGSEAFRKTSKLNTVVLPKSIKSIGANAFYSSGLTSIELPEGLESIGNNAFYDCRRLTSVTLPEGLKTLGSGAFNGCIGLKTVNFPASLTSVGADSFRHCYALSSIDLTDSVESIGNNAFNGCMNLTSVKLPESVKSIGDGAFAECDKLQRINIPASVTRIGANAFNNCYGLNNVVFPDGLKEIGATAFCNCRSNLTKVELPDSVEIIGDGAFSGCKALTEVKLPCNIKEIKSSTFNDCRALKSIELPDSVESIGNNAFNYCISLPSFFIPSNVKHIGSTAFQHCASITEVYFPASVESVGDNAFNDMISITDVYICDTRHYYSDIQFGKGLSRPTDIEGIKVHAPYGLDTAKFEDLDFTYDGTEHTIIPVCSEIDSENFTYDELKLKEPGTYTMTVKSANPRVCYGEKVLKITVRESPIFEDRIARIAGSSRYDTSRKAAGKLLVAKNTEKYDNVIVAYGGNFPDALGGGYLAKVKKAPIILVDKQNETAVFNDIKANMKSGGNVYILGGTGVVSEGFEKKCSKEFGDEQVKRLAGSSRYDTNLEILKECGTDFEEILVCTGSNYPDSLSASAAGRPILLVEGDKLTAAQKEYLDSVKTNVNKVYAVGGIGAVSEKVVTAVKNKLDGADFERLEGKTRFETSKRVAQKFFQSSKTIVLAVADNFPDGLSGAPLAMVFDAPIVLVTNSEYKDAKAYAADAGVKKGIVFGGTSLISDNVAKSIIK